MDKKKSKGIAALIVEAMPKGKGSEDSDAMEGSDYSIAADEILSAIQEKDSQALGDALKAFVEMCKSDSYEEDAEEEE